MLLRACFCPTPTKRPTASEIVELLLKHPRVVSPCIDVPLASVQIERTDSLEMMPIPKKEAGGARAKPSPLKAKHKDLGPEDQGYGSGAYSPMNRGEESLGLEGREPLMGGWEEEQRAGDGASDLNYSGSHVRYLLI